MQKEFFELAKTKLPPNQRLVDVICDQLNIGADSAYRRIRNEKELTFSELSKLAVYFNISLDSLVNIKSGNIVFRYNRLDLSDMTNYYNYMKDLALLFQNVAKSKEKEITFMAMDIPVPNFTPFLELTLFKIYTWFQGVNNLSITYDEFIQSLDREKLFEHYKVISEAYMQIPSVEIWTGNTIDPILRLINYYHDIERFENTEQPLLLCAQLLQLINHIEKYTERGEKAEGVPFKLYQSPIDIMNDFMITDRDGIVVSSIKLYTINGLFTSDEYFCNETRNWVKDTISKSTFLSGASARERFKFFQNLKNKVQIVSERLERL